MPLGGVFFDPESNARTVSAAQSFPCEGSFIAMIERNPRHRPRSIRGQPSGNLPTTCVNPILLCIVLTRPPLTHHALRRQAIIRDPPRKGTTSLTGLWRQVVGADPKADVVHLRLVCQPSCLASHHRPCSPNPHISWLLKELGRQLGHRKYWESSTLFEKLDSLHQRPRSRVLPGARC